MLFGTSKFKKPTYHKACVQNLRQILDIKKLELFSFSIYKLLFLEKNLMNTFEIVLIFLCNVVTCILNI